MKKKIVGYGLLLAALLTLSQCMDMQKDKLEGIWQLEKMNINGTNLDGHALGNWLWEFNDDGGYLADVGGAKEKGWYKLKDKELTLKITQPGEKPEQVYVINKLDSASMELASTGDRNKAVLRFMKWKEKIGEEEE